MIEVGNPERACALFLQDRGGIRGPSKNVADLLSGRDVDPDPHF